MKLGLGLSINSILHHAILQAANNGPKSPFLDSLLAYYSFDQNATDITGNGNSFAILTEGGSPLIDFTDTSPINQPYAITTTSGIHNGSISTTNSSSILNGSLPFTISFWVQGVQDPTNSFYNLVGTSAATAANPTLIPSIGIIKSDTDPFNLLGAGVQKPTSTCFYFNCNSSSTGNGCVYSNVQTNIDNVYHVVARSSGSGKRIKLTVNNVTYTQTLNNSPSNNSNSSRPFQLYDVFPSQIPGSNVRLDELGIWQRELTDAEVTSLYNSGQGAFYPFPNITRSINYPPGLEYTSGLIGWYDSSQTSSVIKDGSNYVSRWKNLFNGQTSDTPVLSDLITPSADLAPLYTTGNQYIYNYGPRVYVGNLRSGITFDGNGTSLQLETGMSNNMNLTELLVIMSVKVAHSYNQDPIVYILDSQNNFNEGITGSVGSYEDSTYNTWYVSDDLGDIGGVESGIQKSNYSFVRGLQLFNQSNGNPQQVYIRYITGDQGTQNIAHLDGISSQHTIHFDIPWDQIRLGFYTDGRQTTIGEILVFNKHILKYQFGETNLNNASDTHGPAYSLVKYLQNKWK